MSTSYLWRGAVEPVALSPRANLFAAFRGAVEAKHGFSEGTQVQVDRRGGYAVEKELKGQRPTRTQSGAGWSR